MAVSQFLRGNFIAACFAAASFGLPAAASAAPGPASDSPLQVIGFASIVAGRTFDSPTQADYVGQSTIRGRNCPCYVADWTNGGVYDGDLSLSPESRAGIQFTYTATRDLHFVAQIVTRGSQPKPSVQWAYASYAVDSHWEVQLGRKRIPLYYYSDFQDVGTAYPWIGTPPELYGWEVTNYNGASVRYKNKVAGVNLVTSIFGGAETAHDSPYYALYNPGQTRVRWRDMIGADLEGSRGPLTVRAVYMQANVDTYNATAEIDDSARLRAYGVAANLDFDDWFVLAEATRLTRTYDAYRISGPALTVGAGYRWGNWTPFVNLSRYNENSTDRDWYDPSPYKRASFTLRYDIDGRSSVKVQVDRFLDTARNMGDNAKVVRVSYDLTF